MPGALPVIDEIMNPPFKHRLVVLFHLPARNIDQYGERNRGSLFDLIDFGADPDRSTWEAVAQLSGGSYQNIATSASPELATAVNAFLS